MTLLLCKACKKTSLYEISSAIFLTCIPLDKTLFLVFCQGFHFICTLVSDNVVFQARGKQRQVGWFPASHVKLLAKATESTKSSEQAVVNDADDDLYAVPQRRENPAGR